MNNYNMNVNAMNMNAMNMNAMNMNVEEKPKRKRSSKKGKKSKKIVIDPEHANFSFKKTKKIGKSKSKFEMVEYPTFQLLGQEFNKFTVGHILQNTGILENLTANRINLETDEAEIIDVDSLGDEENELTADSLLDNKFKNEDVFTIYIDLELPNVYKNQIILTENNKMTLSRLFRVISYSVRDILAELNNSKLSFEPMDRLNEIYVDAVNGDSKSAEISVALKGLYPDSGSGSEQFIF
jgi:hypothetical protein